jgi:hypothetical protein
MLNINNSAVLVTQMLTVYIKKVLNLNYLTTGNLLFEVFLNEIPKHAVGLLAEHGRQPLPRRLLIAAHRSAQPLIVRPVGGEVGIGEKELPPRYRNIKHDGR